MPELTTPIFPFAPPAGLSARQLRAEARRWLRDGVPAMVLQITQVKGSTPRNAQARMLVSERQTLGTLGGGHLEWQATAWAREALSSAQWAQSPPALRSFALGPSLGQCCGGWLEVACAPLTAESLAAWALPEPRLKVELHGAGHVGQAIVRLLAGLDAQVRWIDERLPDEWVGQAHGARGFMGIGAAGMPHSQPGTDTVGLVLCPTDDAVHEARHAEDGRLHLVITHRHDLDLELVHALLSRPDVREGRAWVGMIGSATKRAAFEHRLRERGHAPDVIAALACPIGLPGIEGKEPEVVAIAVVAQLLAMTSVGATRPGP